MILLIVSSLGVGLFCLVKDHGQTRRTVRALIVRVVISIVLFTTLFLAFALGVIEPHGLY
jgi:hypothetical protein